MHTRGTRGRPGPLALPRRALLLAASLSLLLLLARAQPQPQATWEEEEQQAMEAALDAEDLETMQELVRSLGHPVFGQQQQQQQQQQLLGGLGGGAPAAGLLGGLGGGLGGGPGLLGGGLGGGVLGGGLLGGGLLGGGLGGGGMPQPLSFDRLLQRAQPLDDYDEDEGDDEAAGGGALGELLAGGDVWAALDSMELPVEPSPVALRLMRPTSQEDLEALGIIAQAFQFAAGPIDVTLRGLVVGTTSLSIAFTSGSIFTRQGQWSTAARGFVRDLASGRAMRRQEVTDRWASQLKQMAGQLKLVDSGRSGLLGGLARSRSVLLSVRSLMSGIMMGGSSMGGGGGGSGGSMGGGSMGGGGGMVEGGNIPASSELVQPAFGGS